MATRNKSSNDDRWVVAGHWWPTLLATAVLFALSATPLQAQDNDELLQSFRRVDEVISVVQQHLHRPISRS